VILLHPTLTMDRESGLSVARRLVPPQHLGHPQLSFIRARSHCVHVYDLSLDVATKAGGGKVETRDSYDGDIAKGCGNAYHPPVHI
jgi:hypothetical protein